MSIREAQIREILDEDTKFYKVRYEMEKKAARMNEQTYAPPNRFEKAVAFNIDKYFIDLRAAIDTSLSTQMESDIYKAVQLYELTVKYIDTYSEKRGLVQRDISIIEDKFDALKPAFQNLETLARTAGLMRIIPKLQNIVENIENRTYSYQDVQLPPTVVPRPGQAAAIAIAPALAPQVAAKVRRNKRTTDDMWRLYINEMRYYPYEPLVSKEFFSTLATVPNQEAFIALSLINPNLFKDEQNQPNYNKLSVKAERTKLGVNASDYNRVLNYLQTDMPLDPLDLGPPAPQGQPGQEFETEQELETAQELAPTQVFAPSLRMNVPNPPPLPQYPLAQAPNQLPDHSQLINQKIQELSEEAKKLRDEKLAIKEKIRVADLLFEDLKNVFDNDPYASKDELENAAAKRNETKADILKLKREYGENATKTAEINHKLAFQQKLLEHAQTPPQSARKLVIKQKTTPQFPPVNPQQPPLQTPVSRPPSPEPQATGVENVLGNPPSPNKKRTLPPPPQSVPPQSPPANEPEQGDGRIPDWARPIGHTEGLELPKKKGRGIKLKGGISNAEDEDIGRPQGVDNALKVRNIDKQPSDSLHFAPDEHLTLKKRMTFLNQLDTHTIREDDAQEFNSTRNLYRSMERRLKRLK